MDGKTDFAFQWCDSKWMSLKMMWCNIAAIYNSSHEIAMECINESDYKTAFDIGIDVCVHFKPKEFETREPTECRW